MNVTSMLSNGYLEPSRNIRAQAGTSASQGNARAGAASSSQDLRARTASSSAREDTHLARQEQDILSQEQNLRAKVGAGTEVHTVYHYTMGADGRRYITGASVSMKGAAEDLNRANGGIATQDIQAKEDEAAQKVAGTEDKSGSRKSDDASGGSSGGTDSELSEEEKAVVRELKQAEREVIAHEAAHMAAAGALGGGVSYGYTQGPDGKSYITSGEVPIRMKQGSTPEETLRNMQQVQRAALAPADPSGQDRQVAAQAAAMAAQARSEISAKRAAEARGDEKSAQVAKGTPVQGWRQEEEDPSKKGVASIIASIRASQIQGQLTEAA